jgi:hypothetical protein
MRPAARRGSRTAGAEVTYARGPADRWRTRYDRVQPAPGAPADVDLMDAIVTALEALESEPGHVPFVRAVD